MKYITLITILFFLSCNMTKRNKQPLEHKQQHKENEYLVTKIDSIPKAYIIYVERNDSIFKLVSLKEGNNLCTKIIAGNYYELNLGSWLNADKPSLIHSDGLYVSGVGVSFSDENIVQNIFYAKNLKGLCISKTN
ncbi:hypothetical protein [Edaphocola aurantiacus]|uniref:hypothetical protein n=1 Tax=Edaphocola aurantiacus TaxID=2601682 RepID=UPI001C9462BF|nr:hypothetical protein [Edaphocola aurantiacus]